MAKRQLVMSEIGGVMIAVGVIWFGYPGSNPAGVISPTVFRYGYCKRRAEFCWL